jgi:hypothetical protein
VAGENERGHISRDLIIGEEAGKKEKKPAPSLITSIDRIREQGLYERALLVLFS